MKSNNQSQWCIVFGKAASHHPAPQNYEKFIGTYVLQGKLSPEPNKPKLFSFRSDAETFAKKFADQYGNRWKLSVIKFNVRLSPNPYETKYK